MAWVERYNTGKSDIMSTTYTPVLPPHSSGDLLMLCLTQDVGSTAITQSGGSDWTLVGTQEAYAYVRQVWYWKIATSSNESVTFDGTPETWVHICVVIQGHHSTTPIHGSTRTDWEYVSTITSGSLTTTQDNCLILYSWGSDGAPILIMDHEDMGFLGHMFAGGETAICGWDNLPAAGSVPTKTIWSVSSYEGGNSWVIAIANATTGGGLSPRLSDWFTPVHRGGFIADGVGTAPTWSLLSSISGLTAIDGTPVGTAMTTTNSTSELPTTTLSSTENAAVWAGSVTSIPGGTTDLSSSLLTLSFSVLTTLHSSIYGPRGAAVIFADTSNNWAVYRLALYRNFLQTTPQNIAISTSSDPDYSSASPINWSAVDRVGYMYDRLGTVGDRSITVSNLLKHKSAKITGGCVNKPCNMAFVAGVVNNTFATTDIIIPKQGNSQVIQRISLQFGDGSTSTYVNLSRESSELPPAFNEITSHLWRSPADFLEIKFKTSSTDTIITENYILSTTQSAKLTFDAACSQDATYRMGGWSIIGFLVTWQTAVPCAGVYFINCKEIDGKAATFSNCTISGATETHALALDAGASVAGTSFTKGSDTYALKLRTAGTYNLQGTTFSGYTTPIKITATTGTVTLTLNSGQTQPTYSSDGATVVYDQPLQECGLTINDLVAGSQVVVFEAGTQTELERDDNTGTTFEWSVFAASEEVDYTIQKAGYLPQRFAGLTLTSVQVSDANQQIDRAYVASSGLTFGTTADADTTGKEFDLTTASTGQNFYSFMIESWIAESSLANVAFPIVPNGPNSFSLIDGWEFTATSLPYLSRDGLRYVSTGGTQTAVWAALLSVGTSAGMQVRYQQSDGGTTGEAATTGPIDELIQIYGDSTHGNFDYRSYLKLKVQADGYDEANADAIATYGNLEDQLYIVGLAPLSNGLATGNPSVTGVTITDHGASPVTWNSKSWSITITDSGTNSGTAIMRWLRYNFAAGGTFQSKDAFNWHDLVQVNGTKFKSVRGPIYGDTGATLKGVRVLRGTDPHPDFDLFTADDGTTYAPPPTASVIIGGAVAGTRIQLYDNDSNQELLNSATAPFVWTETYNAPREIRLRAMQADADSAKLFIDTIIGTITESSPTISYLVDQDDDTVYATNGVDGSLVTGITIDDDNLLINVDDDTLTWATIYAYETYWLTTEEGIRDEGRIIDATDTANYRFHGFKIKNVGSGPLVITGGYGVDAATGTVAALFDTTGNSIFPAPDHVVAYSTGAETTVAIVQQGLTAQGLTTTRAGYIDRLDAAITTRAPATDTALLTKSLRNNRAVVKDGSTWKLVVLDDDDTTPILSKVLKDVNGNDIADLAAGALAQEEASDV